MLFVRFRCVFPRASSLLINVSVVRFGPVSRAVLSQPFRSRGNRPDRWSAYQPHSSRCYGRKNNNPTLCRYRLKSNWINENQEISTKIFRKWPKYLSLHLGVCSGGKVAADRRLPKKKVLHRQTRRNTYSLAPTSEWTCGIYSLHSAQPAKGRRIVFSHAVT